MIFGHVNAGVVCLIFSPVNAVLFYATRCLVTKGWWKCIIWLVFIMSDLVIVSFTCISHLDKRDCHICVSFSS